MPKEIINPRHFGTNEDPSPFLEVGWCKHSLDDGSHVQVGALAGGDYNESETPRPGFYVSLDREGINRLIRSLRRARHGAFGKDA